MLESLQALGLVVNLADEGGGETVWSADFLGALIWLSGVYPGRYAFRGHSNASYALHSRLTRVVMSESPSATYDDVLLRERGIVSEIDDTDWLGVQQGTRFLNRLALMQHQGVPTRLLDLTADPLVAVYFAVEKEPAVDGAVILIRDTGAKVNSAQSSFRLDPSSAPYAVWTPPPIGRRIISQRGQFLVANSGFGGKKPDLNDPYGVVGFSPRGSFKVRKMQTVVDNYLNGEYRGRPKKYPPNLVMFQIPKTKKAPLARMLGRFGLTKRSIYPDLEGYVSSFSA